MKPAPQAVPIIAAPVASPAPAPTPASTKELGATSQHVAIVGPPRTAEPPPPAEMPRASTPVVAVPSERWPLLATDCYQLFDTSDLPGGVISIVTGKREELSGVLAAHDDVDGMWYWGSADGAAAVEKLSAGNMKRTWVDYGRGRDWFGPGAESEVFLREATQVKNIWIPYGA
jgi:hypothetical protein